MKASLYGTREMALIRERRHQPKLIRKIQSPLAISGPVLKKNVKIENQKEQKKPKKYL